MIFSLWLTQTLIVSQCNEMISLRNFFSGTTTYYDTADPSGSIITQDVTFGTVTDVNRTMVFYTALEDYDIAFEETNCLSIYLLNETTLRIQWRKTYNITTGYTIRWWVLEFTEGVLVQHYYSTTQPSSPITINPVDVSRSFIIPSWMIYGLEGSATAVNIGANFSFADSTSVTLTNAGSRMYNVAMQIVQWDGAVAQHAITNISTALSVDVSINPVNLDRAIVFSTNNWTSSSDPTSVQEFARCFLNDSTSIKISVDATGYSQDLATSVVEIPQFTVQRGMNTLDSTSTGVTISEVDLSNSVAWVSMPNRPWGQRNEPSANQIFGGAQSVLSVFNNATEIELSRGRPWSGLDADWQILEFNPPPPVHGFTLFQDPGII